MGRFDSLHHFLREPAKLLDDLRKKESEMAAQGTRKKPELELHSKDNKSERGGGFTTGVKRAEDSGEGVKLTLASLRRSAELVKSYNGAAGAARAGMLEDPIIKLELFSIICVLYRPGPAFRLGHEFPSDDDMTELTGPGGETWASVLGARRLEIEQWARHAVRLDNRVGRQKGSGTVMSDGTILTAGHVINFPGWIFGTPPSRTGKGAAGMNCVTGGKWLETAVSGYTEAPKAFDCAWIHTGLRVEEIPAADGGRLLGLELVKKKPGVLTGDVLVIGHPGPPGAEEKAAAEKVYRDAPLGRGLKRLMPGRLDPDQPVVNINGVEFLRHDCSTLAGTSGGCVLDLKTGAILGIHVSGIESGTGDRNLAVAAWSLHEAMENAARG